MEQLYTVLRNQLYYLTSLIFYFSPPKVYACGEGTSGRLGIGEYTDQSSPKLLTELSTYVVRRVATSVGGRHAMALTADGKIFSWGDGELGQLGHGDNQYVWGPGNDFCTM